MRVREYVCVCACLLSSVKFLLIISTAPPYGTSIFHLFIFLVDKKEVAAGLNPQKELKDSGFLDLSRM